MTCCPSPHESRAGRLRERCLRAMRLGFFVCFSQAFFELTAKHFWSNLNSTAAAEQPRRGRRLRASWGLPRLLAPWGPQGGFSVPSGALLRGPLLRSFRKALGALLSDKDSLQGFRASGQPRAALRKAFGGPPSGPGRLPRPLGAPKRGRGSVQRARRELFRAFSTKGPR